MRAETGVGPAIASGSQTYRGIWALFPAAPTKNRMQTRARTGKPQKVIFLKRSAIPLDSSAIWLRSSRNSTVGPSFTPLGAVLGRTGATPRTAPLRPFSGTYLLVPWAHVPESDQKRMKRPMMKPKRSEEHTSELQSRFDLVCRLLLEK